jgi:uncharacterized protein (DUF433 family)
MNSLQQFEKLLASLKPSEKARILQWVAQDLGDAFPGIDSTTNICGGEPCIVRTRIPVWLLIRARNLGVSEAEILSIYPTLRAEDLVNAWAYYRSHQQAIDQQILENEAA